MKALFNTKAKPLFPAHPTQVLKERQQEAMEYRVFIFLFNTKRMPLEARS